MAVAKSIHDEGELYFNTFRSRIFKYPNISFKDYIQAIYLDNEDLYLKNLLKSDDMYSFYRIIKFKSIIIHELTHYLDLTSTLWGAEYNYRKILCYEKNISDNIDNIESKKLFYLNFCEVTHLHESYQYTRKISDYKKVENFTHNFGYSKKHGIILEIFLNYNNYAETIPISLLTVFETHALSNEYLSRLSALKYLRRVEDKRKYLNNLSDDYFSYINNTDYNEYNIFLKLLHIHFDKFKFNLKEMWEFSSALMGFTLELSGNKMASIANLIFKSIDSEYKYCVLAELQRGLLRHIIAFKTILLIHGYLITSSQKDKNRMIFLLKNKPLSAINEFWDGMVGDKIISISNIMDTLETEVLCNCLKAKDILKTGLIFNKYYENNKKFISSSYIIKKLSDYYLLGMLRDEETFEPYEYMIKFPKNFGIDYEEYWNSNDIKEIEKIDIAMEDESLHKFHLSLQEARDMYFDNLAVSQNNSGISMILNFR